MKPMQTQSEVRKGLDATHEPDAAAILLQELGAELVTPGEQIDARYFTAYNEAPGIRPRALVRPRTVADVSRALSICARLGQRVVPQGGRTGLARGAVPMGGEIVLSLERLAGIEEIDAQAGTLTVLAGTLLQSVQEAADEAGFALGIDLGARGSCQIGGNIATNAGGNRAIRFGVMREQVLGLEVVLADGTVVSSLNKMLKNNAGYDLKHLFIGSEGTLGVITRAVLRLHPKLALPATAMCAVSDYDTLLRFWQRVRNTLPFVVSFEVMWPDFYGYVSTHTPDLAPPLPAGEGLVVLLECAAPVGADAGAEGTAGAAMPALEACLSACLEEGLVDDAALATSIRQARDMWALREAHTIDELPHLINYDVSLPIGDIGAFVEQSRAALLARWPHSVNLFFGHIGDSNVHIGVSLIDLHAHGEEAVDRVVYEVVREMGGSISAEHGIGQLKRSFLDYSRGPAEIALMRQVKAALDPKGILNPGKVL
jgi:FAD/FMN-containing dehydrogenase